MNGIELMRLAINNATLIDYSILISTIISFIYLLPTFIIIKATDDIYYKL